MNPRRRRPILKGRSMRSPSARHGSARSALSEETKESGMRAIFVAAVGSVGIVLLAVSPVSAAPAVGGALGRAANISGAVDQVHWRGYHYRHWWWRHPWRHRWW